MFIKDLYELLIYIKDVIINCLEELEEVEENDFIIGEKHAYVEILETIQERWADAFRNGLDFDIEERFPLDSSKD